LRPALRVENYGAPTEAALLYGRQDSHSAGSVPDFNCDAVHVLLGLGNDSVIVFATDDHGHPLNVPLLVYSIEAIIGPCRESIRVVAMPNFLLRHCRQRNDIPPSRRAEMTDAPA